mmetsp:Transcript_29860/g.61389  ORF Transcript_29860/g.61389 Transcript_29860/m.61389 type:complete len:267 (+) Transcript_29860:831-1631(+)
MPHSVVEFRGSLPRHDSRAHRHRHAAGCPAGHGEGVQSAERVLWGGLGKLAVRGADGESGAAAVLVHALALPLSRLSRGGFVCASGVQLPQFRSRWQSLGPRPPSRVPESVCVVVLAGDRLPRIPFRNSILFVLDPQTLPGAVDCEAEDASEQAAESDGQVSGADSEHGGGLKAAVEDAPTRLQPAQAPRRGEGAVDFNQGVSVRPSVPCDRGGPQRFQERHFSRPGMLSRGRAAPQARVGCPPPAVRCDHKMPRFPAQGPKAQGR